ncbi:MAG: sialate O-acetylesterase [Lachnospiraceae bacterium]|nr:sialate O-acetylesterase [Lachnospiraceae bacterium]
MLIGEKVKKTEYLKRLLVLMLCIISTMFILVGCSDERIIYPVEVVEKEEAEELIDGEETSDEDSESLTDEVEETEEDEEFELLDVDETEAEEDEEGNAVTNEGEKIVDLVFFMGQSNMSGAGGNAALAPDVLEGQGYEFRAVSDPTKLYGITEPFGKNESFIGGICDLPGAKKGSIVSCFANEYYALTGVPIVGVSASQGASTTEIWLSSGFQNDMDQRFNTSVKWLEDNGYYIRNRYAIWFQGESDAANHVSPDLYNTNMDNIIRPLFIGGLTKVFIVTPGRTLSIKNYFDDIIDEQLTMCKESGYYALGTNILSKVPASNLVDEWHYNQQTLNLIGIETARSAAFYTLNRAERIDYDYEHDEVFIPDGFDYSGEETVEPYDLSDVQKLVDAYWEDYIARNREE